MSENIGDVTEATYELIQKFRCKEIPLCDTIKDINEHISKYCACASIEEFSGDLEWFNVSRPLTFKEDLKGKVILLDFFTYCCINCLHILPDLKRIEREFSVEQGVVVVGVHSAKFDNEKDSTNLLSAIQRYEINHPVVNDSNAVMWNQLGISCWPSIVILGPNAQPLFLVAGEGYREELTLFVQTTLAFFKQNDRMTDLSISDHSLPTALAAHLLPPSLLLFPGKVAYHKGLLAISDTGHHRILITSHEGALKLVVGGSTPGFTDGKPGDARFNNPQGVTFYGSDVVFVADTDNHAIRKIDLSEEGMVSTVAGDGAQGRDKEGGGIGLEQPLNSPWDLCISQVSNSSCGQGDNEVVSKTDVLLIAMAGGHQIWAYFLEDTVWWRDKPFSKGQCVAIAGSGLEENRNNAYPHAAGFAQPSGITSSPQCIFVADSESSSIRRLWLADGKVTAVVGGNVDPQMLFTFGDADGKGRSVRLQHPLGVAFHNGNLYVADTYNHKIKIVRVASDGGVKDASTKSLLGAPKEECVTVLGTGQPGELCGDLNLAQLNEPGGLCATDEADVIFVADTNNHCIKKVNFVQNIVRKVIIASTETDSAPSENVDSVIREIIHFNPHGGTLSILPKLILSENWSYTHGAPVRMEIVYPKTDSGIKWPEKSSGNLAVGPDCEFLPIKIVIPPGSVDTGGTISLKLKVFVCSKNDTCSVKLLVSNLSVVYVENASSEQSLEVMHSIL
ncbi:NHL repeat-containing protein 2 [Ischnura elegans]|uniref:NHL repeat-containing protein 2 n=1 Tax=Ischnura elegans TaxID=197161 RepID=UPI001ED87DE0|nr:NHL repeat-containing protein 2 [Ischnura elegans]XP_046386852.1 NHL repeat-containing protein 2 [Ischnura elegans]